MVNRLNFLIPPDDQHITVKHRLNKIREKIPYSLIAAAVIAPIGLAFLAIATANPGLMHLKNGGIKAIQITFGTIGALAALVAAIKTCQVVAKLTCVSDEDDSLDYLKEKLTAENFKKYPNEIKEEMRKGFKRNFRATFALFATLILKSQNDEGLKDLLDALREPLHNALKSEPQNYNNIRFYDKNIAKYILFFFIDKNDRVGFVRVLNRVDEMAEVIGGPPQRYRDRDHLELKNENDKRNALYAAQQFLIDCDDTYHKKRLCQYICETAPKLEVTKRDIKTNSVPLRAFKSLLAHVSSMAPWNHNSKDKELNTGLVRYSFNILIRFKESLEKSSSNERPLSYFDQNELQNIAKILLAIYLLDLSSHFRNEDKSYEDEIINFCLSTLGPLKVAEEIKNEFICIYGKYFPHYGAAEIFNKFLKSPSLREEKVNCVYELLNRSLCYSDLGDVIFRYTTLAEFQIIVSKTTSPESKKVLIDAFKRHLRYFESLQSFKDHAAKYLKEFKDLDILNAVYERIGELKVDSLFDGFILDLPGLTPVVIGRSNARTFYLPPFKLNAALGYSQRSKHVIEIDDKYIDIVAHYLKIKELETPPSLEPHESFMFLKLGLKLKNTAMIQESLKGMKSEKYDLIPHLWEILTLKQHFSPYTLCDKIFLEVVLSQVLRMSFDANPMSLKTQALIKIIDTVYPEIAVELCFDELLPSALKTEQSDTPEIVRQKEIEKTKYLARLYILFPNLNLTINSDWDIALSDFINSLLADPLHPSVPDSLIKLGEIQASYLNRFFKTHIFNQQKVNLKFTTRAQFLACVDPDEMTKALLKDKVTTAIIPPDVTEQELNAFRAAIYS